MDPSLLSNAYLVADRAGGTAVFVDSGAPIEPLVAAVERLEVQVTHLLTTHAHSDHVAHHEELERRLLERILPHLPGIPREPWVGVEAAAQHAAVSIDTIRRAIGTGELRHGRAGTAYRLRLSDVDAWVLHAEPAPPITDATDDEARIVERLRVA